MHKVTQLNEGEAEYALLQICYALLNNLHLMTLSHQENVKLCSAFLVKKIERTVALLEG